jgi:diadenosine tetraphosphatase ApaH/serine/threonine PP2A family protein phosphatase
MIAVISDIHGNLEALQASLGDARREGARGAICLGDIVGYGADPQGCIQTVRELVRKTVLGNHDAAVLDPAQAENFNDVARTAIEWTRDQLHDDDFAFLRGIGYEYAENGARYVHSSPYDPPGWHYILNHEEAWDALGACPESICFVGHSHVPARVVLRSGRLEVLTDTVIELGPDERALINVGSIGQPRDGDRRAAYVLFDPEARRIIARRVSYDIETASRKILEAGLPEILARRLSLGQ